MIYGGLKALYEPLFEFLCNLHVNVLCIAEVKPYFASVLRLHYTLRLSAYLFMGLSVSHTKFVNVISSGKRIAFGPNSYFQQ